MIDPQLMWAVGLFEGEGCITTNGNYFRIKLKMSDLDVVNRFKEVVGCGKVVAATHPSMPDHYKDLWEWRTGRREDITNVLNSFLPHLGQRRAYKALNILDTLELA